MTTSEYARELFDDEIKAAKEHLDKFSVHWELAEVLAKRYGFRLPDLTQAISADSPTATNGTARTKKARTRAKVPSMPKMILRYFKVHQRVAEPKEINAWVKETYPRAKIKPNSIGQTMIRMRKADDGRLYSYRYLDQQSAQYGLPSWKRSGYHHGFEPEYLPDSLRSEAQLELAQQGSGIQ